MTAARLTAVDRFGRPRRRPLPQSRPSPARFAAIAMAPPGSSRRCNNSVIGVLKSDLTIASASTLEKDDDVNLEPASRCARRPRWHLRWRRTPALPATTLAAARSDTLCCSASTACMPSILSTVRMGSAGSTAASPIVQISPQLARQGVNYLDTSTSKPSNSSPGLMALVTGGSPRTVGAFYDVASTARSSRRRRPRATGLPRAAAPPGRPRPERAPNTRRGSILARRRT